MNIHNGQLYGLGSSPSYNPSVFAKPLLAAVDLRRAQLRGPGLAAARSRDQRPLSDRLDLQADHGAGGARFRRRSARTRSSTTPASIASATAGSAHNAGDAVNGVDRPAPGAEGLLRRLLLHARRQAATTTPATAGRCRSGRSKLGLGEPTGLDIGGDADRAAADSGGAQPSSTGEHQRPDSPCGKEVVPTILQVGGSRIGRGRPATTSTSRLARAISRPIRCRWPSPMPRSPTAATSSRPHVGLRVEDPEGRTIQEIDPPVRSHVDIDPAAQQTIMAGLHDAAMAPAGTSYPVFCNYPVEIAGKTGTAERGLDADQSWYMALAPVRRSEVRGRGDGRARRLRRRLGGPGCQEHPQPAAPRRPEQGRRRLQRERGWWSDGGLSPPAPARLPPGGR